MNTEVDDRIKKHFDRLMLELGENHAAKIRVQKLLEVAASVQGEELQAVLEKLDDLEGLVEELSLAADIKVAEFNRERQIMRRTFADALKAVAEGHKSGGPIAAEGRS